MSAYADVMSLFPPLILIGSLHNTHTHPFSMLLPCRVLTRQWRVLRPACSRLGIRVSDKGNVISSIVDHVSSLSAKLLVFI
jgi:hypothetical protein